MNSNGRWLSKAAVLWVLYEAEDVPAHLLATLIAIAASTDSNGKGAYISAATVAMLTRKTESQAKRDLRALEDKKLLLRGNQRIVAHIRSDRRPVVYDVAMPERGSADATSSTPRGSADATSSDGHGVASTPARGSTHAPHGVAPVLPEEIPNRSRKGARRASAKGARAPQCDRDGPGLHSDACRVGDSRRCGSPPPDGFCKCRCHGGAS